MIKPMLVTLVDAPFDDKGWIFETKWDGYRLLAVKDKGMHLLSRGGHLLDDKFDQIRKELSSLPGAFIFDGEVVILDSKGRSEFQLLQNYQRTHKGTPYYYVFDILSWQGRGLRQKSLMERKALLEKVIQNAKLPHVRYSSHRETKGKRFFKEALAKGLEGIIAKKKDSLYVGRRTRDWLKIKTTLRQEVVIGGFTKPKGSRPYLGALLVGVYDGTKLQFCGRVGGGFNHADLKEVYKRLTKLKAMRSPFTVEPDCEATWVRPVLVAEVSFREWTDEEKMRQPIFIGLRFDKKPRDVVREKPRCYGKA